MIYQTPEGKRPTKSAPKLKVKQKNPLMSSPRTNSAPPNTKASKHQRQITGVQQCQPTPTVVEAAKVSSSSSETRSKSSRLFLFNTSRR